MLINALLERELLYSAEGYTTGTECRVALLQGWTENQTHISPRENRTMAMEEFNFVNLQAAASCARRGSNSAVLKRVEYYCHHALLKDGRASSPDGNEFNRYCASSGRLPIDRFRVDVRSYESPQENYVRILGAEGEALVEQLLADSGIEAFRSGVTRYLTEEKRPLLLANVATDLRPITQAL